MSLEQSNTSQTSLAPVDLMPLEASQTSSTPNRVMADPHSPNVEAPRAAVLVAKDIWDRFWVECKAKHERMLKEEMLAKRQARENRERVKPTKSVKVFLWEWTLDDPPVFVKQLVCVDHRKETLEQYHYHDITIYDSFLNEWHCTDSWEEKLYDTDDTNDKEDPSPPNNPAPPHELDAQTPSPPSVTTSNLSSFKSQRTQIEVLCLLYRYYSFVPPLPLPSCYSGFWVDADWQSLIAILALDKEKLTDDFFLTPLGKLSASFLRSFSGKDPERRPDPDHWDLSEDNRQTLMFSRQVNAIRNVRSSSSDMWFMFDFGNSRSVPWNLVVSSVTVALYVCHLNDNMAEDEIALDLVQEGI
ncbi:hypothetical protein AN958_09352 [Leucoagaricus sp. SymC.cos]|nr:hypothetical protein AN958_09352 [Leucoagaricus sp. SymC.cos]